MSNDEHAYIVRMSGGPGGWRFPDALIRIGLLIAGAVLMWIWMRQ